MASIGTGPSRGARRDLNHDLPLVPFIDFLLCLIAFLLVTAVWSHLARLEADAKVPGRSSETPAPQATELHVSVTDQDFLLKWEQGETVLESLHVPKNGLALPDGSLRYPELGRIAAEQWHARGSHRAASDVTQDRAVLHTPNSLEFRELVAVLDALRAPQRAYGNSARPISAFSVAFATD